MDSPPDPFQLLRLPPDADRGMIRRRYAELLRLNRPDDDPAAFQNLRWAYEACLLHSEHRAAAAEPAANVTPSGDAGTETDPAAPVSDVPVAVAATADSAAGTVTAALAHPAPPAPAMATTVSPLRPPEVVAQELLAVADLDQLRAHMESLPELENFTSRERIERCLLQKIGAGAPIAWWAFDQFQAQFGWDEIGVARRMLAGGPLVQRDFQLTIQRRPALELEKQLSIGPWLSKHPQRIEAERQFLESLRRPRDRWRIFLSLVVPGPWLDDRRNVVLNYVRTHGMDHALAAFDATHLETWMRAALPGAVHIDQLGLRLVRVLAFAACAFALMFVVFALAAVRTSTWPDPKPAWQAALWIAAAGIGMSLAWFALQWAQSVGIPRLYYTKELALARWRERLTPTRRVVAWTATIALPLAICAIWPSGWPDWIVVLALWSAVILYYGWIGIVAFAVGGVLFLNLFGHLHWPALEFRAVVAACATVSLLAASECLSRELLIRRWTWLAESRLALVLMVALMSLLAVRLTTPALA